MSAFGGVLLTIVCLAAGWVGLWPLRGRLGPAGYHLAAYPVGLLLWPVIVALEAPFRIGFQPLPALALLVLALFAAASYVRRWSTDSPAQPVPAWTFLVWGGLVVGVSALVAATGITLAAYDSIFHYERWGFWIWETGQLHKEIMGSYGSFIPSIHAANRYFGGDWTSTPYPVLSLHVAALFTVAVRAWTRARVDSRVSWAITLGFLALMLIAPRYVHHTLYVHSHMISAAYLFLSLFALQRAYLGGEDAHPVAEDGAHYAWLLVAGLAGAGAALTRADGIAYAVVSIAVATLLWLESGRSHRSQLLFLGAAAVPIAVIYASAYLMLGFWRSPKLTGNKAAAVLALLILGSGMTLVIDRIPRLGPWLRQRGKALKLVVIAESVAILGLVALRPARFAESTRNMITNLLQTGGNGYLWYFAIGVVVISLVYRGQWRSGRWPAFLLFAIVQFLAIAVVVHGIGHPGRLSVADSFNRTSFHVIPLVFWYAAMVFSALVADYAMQGDKGLT